MPDPFPAFPAALIPTEVIRMIEDHEGRRTHPYRDTAGCLTIGVGRNLTARGLAADEIDLLRDNDPRLARAICAICSGRICQLAGGATGADFHGL